MDCSSSSTPTAWQWCALPRPSSRRSPRDVLHRYRQGDTRHCGDVTSPVLVGVQFPTKDTTFLCASFYPMTYLLECVTCIAILRKIYRYCYPEMTRQRSSISADGSGNEKAAMTLKGVVTNFEIATGAELQTRFGLISDYNNYVYFKGMKFASADGVYCSGYVVVHNKYLVKTADLLSIVLIKLLRTRFTNVYAYEVEGQHGERHRSSSTSEYVLMVGFMAAERNSAAIGLSNAGYTMKHLV